MPCELNPSQCQNGATCTDDKQGGYSCACAKGYAGINCDTGSSSEIPILFQNLENTIIYEQ